MRHDRAVIDLEAERAVTPGCRTQVFLDSAGSSLPPQQVVDTVIAHVRREAEIGGYRAAAERAQDLEGLRASLGQLLQADADLFALSDSATRSWNQFVTALPWGPGDRVLVGGMEYASNAIALLQRARFDGCSVEVVPSDSDGRIDLGALESMIDERVRLVSLVHVATNSGRVNPVRKVADIAHRAGALVLLDACQSVGQIAIDVDALGIDALTATGRKWLRGPRGTGFLYVRRDVLVGLEPTAVDLRGGAWSTSGTPAGTPAGTKAGTDPGTYELRSDATRFELWEHDVAGRLGLKAAVDHLLSIGPAEAEHAIRTVAAHLRSGLQQLPGVTIQDAGPDLCGIVSFTVSGRSPEQVRDELAGVGVIVTVSHASSTCLDMGERGLSSVVRASPHYFVSPRDVDAAIAAVAALN